MNGHPQFADALALYAMGALDDPQDLAALQAHLGACGECRRELDALRADMALLALSATAPQPPAQQVPIPRRVRPFTSNVFYAATTIC